jgi:hypothetical protein
MVIWPEWRDLTRWQRGARHSRITAMKMILLAAITIVAAATTALAQPLPQPHPKVGQCSGGYYESGGFCVPKQRDSAPAIPKPSGAACPSGWRQSGSTCEKTR